MKFLQFAKSVDLTNNSPGKSFLTMLVCLSFSVSFSQHQFYKTYGGDRHDDARSIIETDDGCYVVTGLYKSDSDILGSTYLMKINSVGAVVWNKFYDKQFEDGGNWLISCNDGGYMIVGHVDVTAGGVCDAYIVKTDSEGNEEWSRQFGGDYDDLTNGGCQTADGSFYFTGCYMNPASMTMDMFFVKFTEDGQLVFMKGLGWNHHEVGMRIAEAADGNLLLVGWSKFSETGDENAHLIKVDPYGNLIWQSVFGESTDERGWGIVPTADGGAVVVGGSIQEDTERCIVAKIGVDGTLLEYKELMIEEGSSYGYDILAYGTGYVISARMTEEGGTHNQPCLIFLDHELSVTKHFVLQTAYEARSRAICALSNGEYILVGQEKENATNSDIMVSRFNPKNGSASISVIEGSEIKLFPNPFSDFTYLKVPGTPSAKTFQLLDINGRIVRHQQFNGNELFIEAGELERGTYIYLVTESDASLVSRGKLVLQ
jgi:hypothetical protein